MPAWRLFSPVLPLSGSGSAVPMSSGSQPPPPRSPCPATAHTANSMLLAALLGPTSSRRQRRWRPSPDRDPGTPCTQYRRSCEVKSTKQRTNTRRPRVLVLGTIPEAATGPGRTGTGLAAYCRASPEWHRSSGRMPRGNHRSTTCGSVCGARQARSHTAERADGPAMGNPDGEFYRSVRSHLGDSGGPACGLALAYGHISMAQVLLFDGCRAA